MANIFTSIGNAIASVGAFIKKEVDAIEGEAPVVVAALENASTIANNLVNALKTWVASPQGQAIEDIISSVPGIGPYVMDVLNFLPTLVQGLGWAKAEFTKSPAQIVQDGITAAVNAATPNIKATNLITLAAHVNTLISSLSDSPLSIQAAVTVAPSVYDNVTPPSTTALPEQASAPAA